MLVKNTTGRDIPPGKFIMLITYDFSNPVIVFICYKDGAVCCNSYAG